MMNDNFELVFNENNAATFASDFGEVQVVDTATDHARLKNRDAANQHPISAITGLDEALKGKQPAGAYLTKETDPTVPAWAKQATKPSYTAEEVGALSAKELPSAVNLALKQAKDSGEFDGPAGPAGKDGYTPVKGVDYFDGQPGKDGADGQPGKDGYTPVKGVDYFDGVPGKDGADGKDGVDGDTGPAGYTPVKGVDYFDGKDGKDGETGPAGYTPVKGVDYYTEAEKAELVQETVDSLQSEVWTFELEDGSTVTKTVVIG